MFKYIYIREPIWEAAWRWVVNASLETIIYLEWSHYSFPWNIGILTTKTVERIREGL